ncbi:hypothetical protein niasHT_025544 [Heterodera trifolii]|uniref:Uncharacterized protein n=1 Tax=Heterodera trifolii TaxID=157864 RepID=A0ABD2K8R9_9BILA
MTTTNPEGRVTPKKSLAHVLACGRNGATLFLKSGTECKKCTQRSMRTPPHSHPQLLLGHPLTHHNTTDGREATHAHLSYASTRLPMNYFLIKNCLNSIEVLNEGKEK